ncbi:hypothetical protein M3936_03545 [Sutcliffiella horikoshii]|uniref:hypothetical protein n=1 Tax=Sutcliffiella horikoshii TaxID=79883 RepID=UPI00204105C5|nr:hypothetical protein [Sutcliffiella horikoshii]MCM3616650.1 hypothetical protein [Sutcliffiella horikoshii]
MEVKVMFVDGSGCWDLAGSVAEAFTLGATYIVDTVEDLNDLATAGAIANELIQTNEGVVKFCVDKEWDADFEEWDVVNAEYRLVS